MQSRTTLDPEQRVLYGASLQPPPGYVFDGAVATTYSLDFQTALAVPVSLALFAAESRDDLLLDPLALLEGAERIAGRLLIFTEAGGIQAQEQPHSRLCSLLERIIAEVQAPHKGAFHPKLWALRFRPAHSDQADRMRLLVLSRNLTRDRSWDIALTLDGVLTRRRRKANRPLADLIRQLPDWTTVDLPDDSRELVEQIADDLRRTEWALPEPFESIAFAVNGTGGKQWQPDRCRRLGVMSPFCDEEALGSLAQLPASEQPILISRSDQLALISRATLDRFRRVSVLDEMAASEDGEDPSAEALLGLHAKAFITEVGWDTVVTVGSANATRPALLLGRNVELIATLTGKRSRVGSVEDILGAAGFGRLTRAFEFGELPPIDPELRAAEIRVEDARRLLCNSGLRLKCERSEIDDSGHTTWRLWLIPPRSLMFKGLGELSVWPITRGEGHRRDALEAIQQGQPVDLGSMPLVDLSRFLAFRLTDVSEKASALFSTGLIIEGLPPERHAAILRTVIDSKDAFFRYLRLLLSELGDPFAAALAAQSGTGHGPWRAAADDAPLFEEMVREFCRGGNRLRAIERLITRLEGDASGPDPIPAEFRLLWETFRIALSSQEDLHAG